MTTKEARITIRIDEKYKEMIEKVSDYMGISMSAFIVMSAVGAARNMASQLKDNEYRIV